MARWRMDDIAWWQVAFSENVAVLYSSGSCLYTAMTGARCAENRDHIEFVLMDQDGRHHVHYFRGGLVVEQFASINPDTKPTLHFEQVKYSDYPKPFDGIRDLVGEWGQKHSIDLLAQHDLRQELWLPLQKLMNGE